MSLNGLDDVKVKGAHDAAIAEPSGWFLLKYASRDEVEVLNHGNGGIVEIRNSIATYEEPSPLYGFLRYRRRSVVIKYIPEDCSRLVQARAAVHFNAICEQFTHHTTFEIGDAKDLKDSKLSAACSLHAASGSSSSSNSSLRRRRLNEIAEAEEEEEEEEEDERKRKRQSVVKEEGRPTSSVYSGPPIPALSPEPPVVLDPEQITNPRETVFASTTNVPDFVGANERPGTPTHTDSRRLSSQSARVDVYSSSSNYGRPKVKLGPRPSLDAHKRPSSAENRRPVAAVPAGFKFKGSKKVKTQEEAHGEQSEHVPPRSEPTPEMLPHSVDEHIPPRPGTSSGASIKSMASSMAPAREGKMSNEKARLMKAMKLREMKMQGAKSQLLSPTDDKSQTGHSAEPQPERSPSIQGDRTSYAVSAVDSAIDLPAPVKPEPDSGDAVLDSHPSSPGATSSTGIDGSTKASSLSESTDEMVQASKEPMHGTAEDAREDAVKLSDIVEETGLQARAQKNENQLQLEPTDAGVSSGKATNGLGEFARIPGNDEVTTEVMITTSIEPHNSSSSTDNNTSLPDGKTLDVAPNHTTSSSLSPTKTSNPSNEAIADTTILYPTVYKPSGDKWNVSQEPLEVSQSKILSNEAKPTSPISPTTPSLKSKFSRQDVTVPTEPIPAIHKPIIPPSITENECANPTVPSKKNPDIILGSPPASTRQKAKVEPILTDLPAKSTSRLGSRDPLDDDALMEELQSATVQEAKPVLVSKSPINPVFPSSPTKDARFPRAVSNPMRNSLMPGDVPLNNTARSVSSGATAFPNNLSRQPSNASSIQSKSNVGSTISQRIKALQALSGKATEENRPRPITPSSTFFTVRKPTTRESSNTPSIVERATPLIAQSPPPAPEPSQEAAPEIPISNRERSGSVASRLSMFEGQNAPRGRPESVQVTARIIRGSRSPFSKSPNPFKKSSDSTPVELKHSALLVDVQRTQSFRAQPIADRVSVVDRPKTSVQGLPQQPPSEAAEKKARRKSSLSVMKDFIKERTTLSNKSTENLVAASAGAPSVKSPSRPPSVHQNSGGFPRRLSTSSRQSSSAREGDNGSISGATSSADEDKSLSDKKSSNRTTRFMRRLSNSFGGPRKGGNASISPTVAEEDADQLEKASNLVTHVSSPTIVAFMGDVNVQFPDNLLWKRRNMCLDSQGYLILTTVQGAAKQTKESVGTKRFYIGDFRKPYIPDVEVEELPNSVALDFLEGSCLQIACLDRIGQQNTLRTLQEAHQTHAVPAN